MFQEEPLPRSCCCLGATGETGHGLQTGNPFSTPTCSLPLTLPSQAQPLEIDLDVASKLPGPYLHVTSMFPHPWDLSQGYVFCSMG